MISICVKIRQMKKAIKILAIESSCDETAAAVIGVENNQPTILSSVVSSQIDLHAKTGGVVPEVASRAHMEAIMPVIEEALTEANNSNLDDITHIAITTGPGLIGSLLVGFNAARALAYAKNLPIIPINHIEGHIYSAFGETNHAEIKFPILALTVSGGHTSLTLMRDHGKYETLGETIDDAAGEAFDKVAKLLDLGYPGGPMISKLANELRERIMYQESGSMGKNSKNPDASYIIPNTITFPRPLLNKSNLDFSFSGLKTAVLTKVTNLKNDPLSTNCQLPATGYQPLTTNYHLPTTIKKEICWAFEEAVCDVLVTKTLRAVEKYEPKTVILAGGVAANLRLRQELKNRIPESLALLIPSIKLCGDNAAMIGLAAYYHILRGDLTDPRSISVNSNLKI